MSRSPMEINAMPARASEAGFRIAAAPDGKSSGATLPSAAPRVLVVEDDYFVSMEIEAVLEAMSCNIIGVVATAEEALEIAENDRPDLILMDIRLAGRIDGIEAASEIQSRFGIRSLFVTAHSDAATRRRGDQTNPLGWVEKPFTTHHLEHSVSTALAILRQTP